MERVEFIPHDYQKRAIDEIVNNKSTGLFLDMGLGKTVITLTAIDRLIYEEFQVDKVLVIAPLQTALNTWSTELGKWQHLQRVSISLILGTAKQREKALKTQADIYVINRENIQWLCDYYKESEWPFDMLVIDELSSFKNPSAKRFKALRKKIPFVSKVVGLTGTPASNGYLDLWSEIYLLDKGERLGKTISQYRCNYFKPGRRNGYIVYEWMLNKGSKELIDNKLKDLCISMKATDYINMPERIETEVYVEMTEKERKIYDQFARDHVLPDKAIVGTNAATVQGKLLQLASGFVYDENQIAHPVHEHKLEALEELKEASMGRPILVFYSFVEDCNRVLARFRDARCLSSTNGVASWNRGEIPILLAHPASAGHGLNLQDGGNIVVWYGLPWSLELYQQANARLYRQGQKNTVYIYHILTKNTHDIDVLNALKRKNLTQEELLRALKARIKEWETD